MTYVEKEIWDSLEESFGGLYRNIAQHISGDRSYDVEDYIQEMKLKTLEVIDKFAEDQLEDPEEFIDSVHFKKYLKTSLWNEKNTLGVEADKFRKIKHYDIDLALEGNENTSGYLDSKELDSIKIVDRLTRDSISEFIVTDFCNILTVYQEKIVNLVMQDRNCYKENGKINLSYIASKLGISIGIVNNEFAELRSLLRR